MAKPHVAIVCTQHRAADTRMFQRWVCGLAGLGWRVTHIAPRGDVDLEYPDGSTLINVEPPGNYIARLLGGRRVIPLIESARPDLILFPDPELFAVLPAYGRRHRIPVIFDRHENFEDPSTFAQDGLASRVIARGYALLERRLTRELPGVVLVLDEMRAALDPQTPVEIARNYPTRSVLEALANPVRPDTRHFTCVHLGALNVERGLYEILEIVRSMVIERSRRDFSICLGGRFPLGHLEKCSIFVSQHGLTENVRLIDGYVPQAEVAELYRASLIGLSPYLRNSAARVTLQNKILEFMGAALPVITSPSSVNGQIVEESGCGALFWAGECDGICDQLEAWMDAPDQAREIGERGRRYVLEKLVWESELERIEPWLLSRTVA